jgi:activator of 2-hydroxyglutaryl-CoA dehydratase
MYIGIDLGTSGVKAILLSEQGEVLASHTEKLRCRVRIRCGRNKTRAVVAGDGPRDESARRAAFPA